MPVPVTIPKLGMTMTEATVVRWLAAVGDRVKTKQPLVEIETEKIVSEIESPADGTLTQCSAAEGNIAPVAATIAWVLADGESVSDIPPDLEPIDGKSETPVSTEECAVSDVQRKPTAGSVPGGPSSPAIRRLARERGVDLTTICGSGPDGRILKEDVLRPIQHNTSSNEGRTFEPLSPVRRAIAATVTTSAAIPQIVLHASADVSALVALHQQDSSIAYDDMLVCLVAKTLMSHKYLNASHEAERICLYAQVNIGLAVAVDQGLLIPVIHGADRLSLRQISVERKRLVEAVRSRRITERDTSGGTFTITNLGMFPVDSFTALLNPPEAAILSVGRIQKVAAPADGGGVVFRPMITFGLTLDHRVVDGAAGAAFLRDLIARMECANMEGL